MITHRNINPKPYTRYGKKHQPVETVNTYNADIVPGKSIRIFGVYRNTCKGEINFDKTFQVGNYAIYDSYNLIYYGQIVAIGPKTITIKHYANSNQVSKLDLHTFCWRNWDFDLQKSIEYNQNESYYI